VVVRPSEKGRQKVIDPGKRSVKQIVAKLRTLPPRRPDAEVQFARRIDELARVPERSPPS
jgi:hypothetical protein